jgi:hypothetical protein
MPNYNTLFEHKLVIRIINDIILIKKKSSFFTNLLRLLNLDTIKFSLSIGFMHLNPSCIDLLLHRRPSITPLINDITCFHDPYGMELQLVEFADAGLLPPITSCV